MKKGIILLILLLAGIILFTITLRQVGLTAVADALSLLSLGEILIVLGVLFTSLVIIGTFKWFVILGKYKGKNAFWTLFIAKWVGFSISHVTPAALLGGEPARYLIVKNETKIESSYIVSSILLEKLSLMLVFVVIFFAGLFFILTYINLTWLTHILGILFIIAGAITAFRIFKRVKKISGEGGFLHFITKKLRLNKIGLIKDNIATMDEVEANMRDFFRNHKDRVLRLFLLSILEAAVMLFSYWLIMYFSGVNLSVPKLVAIRSMVDASYMTPVPAGLGILELVQTYVFQAIGLTSAKGVAFSLIFRGLNLFIASIGIAIFAWMQVKYWGRQLLEKVEQFIIKYTNGKNNH